MRLKPTNRKEFKTGEEKLASGIMYLVWNKAPDELKHMEEKDLGKRVWVAGTSSSDIWFLKSIHEIGDKFFPEGGYTVRNKKGEEMSLFYNEAIIHPRQKV